MNCIYSMTMVDKIIGNSPFLYEGNFSEGIRYARSLGYTGVEIHVADPKKILVCPIKEMLMETGLQLTAIGTGRAYVNEGLSLSSGDNNILEQAINRMQEFIDLASVFKSRIIIGCMRGNIENGERHADTIHRLSISMHQIDQYAEQKGVEILFEPINRYENNFLCSIDEIRQFIENNKLSRTGILIDTFHMNIEEANFIKSILNNRAWIRYVHASDSNRYYPGGGHIPFAAIMSTLNRIGFSGVISSECLPWPSSEEAAQNWIQAVKKLVKAHDGPLDTVTPSLDHSCPSA